MGSLSRVALRQAEARTQLVVDCAGLVRRFEELDVEAALWDQWQKSPDTAYDARVKARFEEARVREAEQARRRGNAGFVSSSPPTGQQWRPASPRHVQEDEERQQALKHIQRALRSADVEAAQWRQRVQDLELASEAEREQARRLLEFELSSALTNAEQEQARLLSQVRDRDAAFDKLEDEHRAIKSESDQQRDLLVSTLRRMDEHKMHQEHIKETLSSKDAELAAACAELQSSRHQGKVAHVRLETLRVELEAAQLGQAKQHQALETSRAEAEHLARAISARDLELTEASRKLDEAARARESLRAELREADIIAQDLRTELKLQMDKATEAKRRAELLNAKCTNLEAALHSATLEQAEAALARDEQQERATRLEQERNRLVRDLEDTRDRARLDGAFDTVAYEATMVPHSCLTSASSPKAVRPVLPPVRPPSAGRRSPKQRHDMLR